MQFNELKATVMDYIWLIRDSLSANNAIYFQFTVGLVCCCFLGLFFFLCKTKCISTDNEGFFRAAHIAHSFLYG